MTRKTTPQPESDTEKEFNDRLVAMMKGEIDPPNVYCKHIVEKLVEIEKEGSAKHAYRRQAQEAISAATTRIVELQGQAKAYREDLRKFDKEIVADTKDEVAQ